MMLIQCQTAKRGQGSAPWTEQGCASAPSAGSDPALGAHSCEGDTSSIAESTRVVPGCHSSTHLAAIPNLLMAVGLTSDEISAFWSTVRTFISSLEVLITLMLESLSRKDKIICRSKQCWKFQGAQASFYCLTMSVVLKVVEKFLEHISN